MVDKWRRPPRHQWPDPKRPLAEVGQPWVRANRREYTRDPLPEAELQERIEWCTDEIAATTPAQWQEHKDRLRTVR